MQLFEWSVQFLAIWYVELSMIFYAGAYKNTVTDSVDKLYFTFKLIARLICKPLDLIFLEAATEMFLTLYP